MITEKKRIFAVDDQAQNTRLLKLHLERNHNYVVREVPFLAKPVVLSEVTACVKQHLGE